MSTTAANPDRRVAMLCSLASLLLLSGVTRARRRDKLLLKIDAGSAPITLAEFVRQSRLQVLFESNAVRAHATRGLSGQFDAAEALALMLEGSGLIFEFINDRTVTVRPSRPIAQPAASFAPTT